MGLLKDQMLGGSFGVGYSDSLDLNRFISENSLRRREECRLDIMVYFGIDPRNGCNDKIKTYYIDKISSPCLLFLIAAKMLQYLYSASGQSRYTC